MDFVLRGTKKAMGDHGIKWGRKPCLDLDYDVDLSILDESKSRNIALSEVLGVQSARIGLKLMLRGLIH